MATIVCDVNETLLDLAALDGPFAELFGARASEVKRLWFARLLHYSGVLSTIGTFHDFGLVGRTVLGGLAETMGLSVDEADLDRVAGTMRSLPPHEDVRDGLSRLADAGHRVVALTNSGQQMAEAQIAAAGLEDVLERVMSVDATLRFKPDRAVYDHAREVLGVPAAELVMVAAHDWDCAGAMRAGWRAGFVARPGQLRSPLLQPPTWSAPDMRALARVLVEAL